MNVNRTWIFDLDGTLIDSEPAIIASCRIALNQIAPQRLFMIEAIKIGPSLPEIGKMLLGSEYVSELANFVTLFKSTYDHTGVLTTQPYAGATELLYALKNRDCTLIVATNKRGIPTRKLIDALGWADYFSWIGCLDEADDPASGKNSIISTYLKERNSGIVCNALKSEQCLFVGDTFADAEVAQTFSIPFVHAAYGYEQHSAKWDGIACFARIKQPLDLLTIKV